MNANALRLVEPYVGLEPPLVTPVQPEKQPYKPPTIEYTIAVGLWQKENLKMYPKDLNWQERQDWDHHAATVSTFD